MKKFASILMGASFDPEKHKAEFDRGEVGRYTCFYTVRNPQEVREKVLQLKTDGFGAIELCGAFSREFALELIALTDNEVAIGYSVHEPEQDELFERFFGK